MRARKRAQPRSVEAASPAPRAEPPAERSSGLAWLGFTLAALGAPTGALGEGAWATGGWMAAIAGGALVVASIALRAREATAPHAWAGGAALVVGTAGVLYPAFLRPDELEELQRSATYAPLGAAALVALGVGLVVYALHRQGPTAPEIALVDPTDTSWSARLLLFWPPRFVGYLHATWKEIDREAEAERAAAGPGYDWRPIAVFSTGAVFLALMEYAGHQYPGGNGNSIVVFNDLVDRMAPRETTGDSLWYVMRDSQFRHLIGFTWWSGWRVLGFFVLPVLVVKLVLRESLASYGLQTHGFLRHAWLYVFCLGIVLVLVVAVSYEPHFQRYYPFYRGASRSWYDFWAWELLYAAQFFSLEFFFRGFWLMAAKRAMGSHAIYAMMVPYCMIHFGKPFLETLAAILAGIVLGTLALRTRSIWSGFLIHVTVAIGMDVAALLQRPAGLASHFWPPL